ncbi:MAG: hypothetical protein ACKOB8_11975 [Mycobacterium sp.]
MEKVIVALRAADTDDPWVGQMIGPISESLLDLGLPGVTLNVRDAPVRDAVMTLTTLDPAVQGFITLWSQQHYGDAVRAALDLLRPMAEQLAAYLVTESAPMPPPASPPGQRADGLANVAMLRRPDELDEATWARRWLHDHTPVAIATQATFGYVQNHVVRALTPDAPAVSAIVEELFPIEAVRSLHAFFGASDDADLQDRLSQMIASTSAFGANVNVDTVPTGRYVMRDPFTHRPR